MNFLDKSGLTYFWSKIKDKFAPLKSGVEFIVGTQTGSTGSWTGETTQEALYDGMQINYYLPYAGNGNASLNLTLAGGSKTGAKPVYRYGTTYVTTHYPANSCIALTYRADKDAWFANGDYNSDNNTYTSAYCSTGASTAAKTASCTNYVLLNNSFLHITITNSNTAASALTLNVNGKGAKPIYINGAASSASNYTLPAGTYIVFYNGTNYYFRTDGKLTANITGDAATVNGKTVGVNVPADAKFTDNNTTYTFENGTNSFKVTPSGGTAQTVTVTPNIANNVTGSGTSGYLTKFNGANTITNGPQLGSDTTKYLRNDGSWAVPVGTVYTGSNGVSVSGTTISNSGVRSVAAGSANGTISVNTNGTSADVAVTGLKALAYKDSLSKSDVGLGNVDNTADANKNVNAATKTGITNTNPTTGTWYYPTWVTGTSGNLAQLVNNGFRYYSLEGTASAAGRSLLQLGNSTATGTAGNKYGEIWLYAEKAGYASLRYNASSTGNTTHTLPGTGGTILNTGTTSVTQTLTSGTEIATIKMNGSNTKLYAPSAASTQNVYVGTSAPSGSQYNVWINPNGQIDLSQIWKILYPIGSIYMNIDSSKDPNTMFTGTTWVRLKDRFLLGAGDTYTNGATGGAATVTLTTNQIPSHNHWISSGEMTYGSGYQPAWRALAGPGGTSRDWDGDKYSGNTGGGQAHENMPPYLVVCMWKRTA